MKFPYRLGSRLQSADGKRPEAVIVHSPLSLVGRPLAEIQMLVNTIVKLRRNNKDIGAFVKSELRKLHFFGSMTTMI